MNRRSFGMGICLALVVCSTLAAQTRPKILGIAHYAIFAHDYEKSRAYYKDFLGFQEPYSLKNSDGTPSMTFFKINERQVIELYPERQADTDRLSHLSFETNDIEALRVYLGSRGLKVPPQAHKGRIGNLSFDVTDPEGHLLEMVQYVPDGLTEREKGKFMSDTQISKWMMHVGIIVTQLTPELKFYEDVLGFQETWRGSHSGTELSWVNVKVPDGVDYVEFMLHKTAPPPTQRGTAHHIALEVDDINTAVASLEAKDYYRDVYKRKIEIHTGINRKRQANLFDPDGTRAEIMEPHTIDGKPTPPSTAPPPQ